MGERTQIESVGHYYSHGRGLLALWIGLLLPPIAWALSFVTSYALVPTLCGSGVSARAVWIGAAAALAATIFGGWTAWRGYVSLRDREHLIDIDRSRAMAVGGLLSSAMFGLTIVAMSIPALFLGPCE